jgi:Flp pilus assembly protein TadD
LGQLYLSQKRLNEAEQSFREVIQRNAGSVSAGTMLGMLLQQQGRGAEAEKEYQRVLAIDARSAVAANNLACIYLDANRNLDEALQLAQTAQQQLVQEPHVADTLGWIYYKKNMLPAAIQHLESGAQKMPNDPTVLYHLGMAYKQSGDWNKARVALKQALTINPGFDGAGEAKKALAVIGA